MDITQIHKQTFERNIAKRVRREVDKVVVIVVNRVNDATFNTMDIFVIARVGLAVRSVNPSSRRGPDSVVNDTERKDFSGSLGEVPLMTASSRQNLNTEN